MYNSIILFIKGLIIGVGKVIPGVSGSVLAISLGVYEEVIKAISHFFKDIGRNFKFLLTLGLGIIVSIVLMSNIVKYFFNNFYLPTMLLFIGLIIGGISLFFEELKGKTKNKISYIIAFTVFAIMILISFFSTRNNVTFFNNMNTFWLFLILGFIEALTTIVPGLSGTAIYMLIGCYDKIIDFFSNLFSYSSLKLAFPFGIGLAIGAILIVKLINYLFNNHKTNTYMGIIGFSISSVFILIIETFNNNYTVIEIMVSLLFLILGYFIARKMKR